MSDAEQYQGSSGESIEHRTTEPPRRQPQRPPSAPDRSALLLATLIEHANDGILRLSAQQDILALNPAARRILGVSAPEVVGRPLANLIPADERQRWAQAFGRVASRRQMDMIEAELLRKDGSRVLISGHVCPLATDEDEMPESVLLIRNLSERRQAEQLLILEEVVKRIVANAASFEQAAPDALSAICQYMGWDVAIIWEVDPQGAFLQCAHSWAHRADTRISTFELVSRQLVLSRGSGVAGRVWKSQQVVWHSDLASESGLSDPRCIPSVSVFGLQSGCGVPIRSGDQITAVLELFSRGAPERNVEVLRKLDGIARLLGQLLQQRSMSRAFQEQETCFHAFMDNSPAVAWMKDDQFRYVYVSKPFCEFFGRPRSDWLGRSDEELWPDIAEYLRQSDQRVLTTNEPMQVYEDVPAPGGNMHHWLVVKFPFQDQLGRRYIGGTAIDISGQRLAEDRHQQLQDHLIHVQKMEAMGRLAGSVAHDFNNVLTIILGNVELMLADPSLTKDMEPLLHEVHEAARKARTLTQQLLTFGRKQPVEQQFFELNSVIAETESLMRRMVGREIELEVELTSDSTTVYANPDHISHVLINLAVNARDAMPNGGRLVIKTATVDVSPAMSARQPELQIGRMVVLTVADTGCGMDEATRQRVFEPFFTTKPAGQGTGLGLSTVYGIVKLANGHITVSSRPGDGAVFTLYFPWQP